MVLLALGQLADLHGEVERLTKVDTELEEVLLGLGIERPRRESASPKQ